MIALDQDDDDLDEPAVRKRRHRGASARLLKKARSLVDEDEALALAQPSSGAPQDIADSIHERLRNLGKAYGDQIVAMWVHLYAGGPAPEKVSLSYQQAEKTWRGWFESEGLAPTGIGVTRQEETVSPFALRPTLEGPTTPVERSRIPTAIDQAWADVQTRQQAAIDAWRNQQVADLRALWAQGVQEGVQNFAEQYPELSNEELLSNLDSMDSEDDGSLGPHMNSIGKMVGQLTNLLMLAPAPAQIAEWFDKNSARVQQTAETLAWQAEQKGYREAGSNFGLEIEWQTEDDANVCDDCAALGDEGPYTSEEGDNPLPAFPGDGSTICGPNCRCSLNYLEPDKGGFAETGAGDFLGPIDEFTTPGVGPGFDLGSASSALGVETIADLEGVSALDTFEEVAMRSRNLDVEVGFAFDSTGRILDSAVGDATSVEFSQAQLAKQYRADLIVHNHPSSSSFSPTDVAFAFSQEVKEMRVVSPEYDYVLKPLGQSRFYASDASHVVDAAQKHAEALYPAVQARALAAYKLDPSVSYAEHFRRASVGYWHDVWTVTAKEGHFSYERKAAPKVEQMVHVQPANVTEWNREWVEGEHGGKSFETETARVDVVRPIAGPTERVFIGGSRGVTDIAAIRAKIDALPATAVIVTSRTFGASAAVREVAAQQGRPVEVWTARFEKFPTKEAAYFARDEEMIRSSDRVVEFWDSASKGTSHEIEYAKSLGKPVDVTARNASLQEAQVSPLGQLPLTFPKSEADLLKMEKVGGPTGSNEGQWMVDKKAGISYYVKPMDSAHATNEVGAMRAYELAGAKPGVDIPWTNVIYRTDDKPVVVSRKVDFIHKKTGSWWNSPDALAARTDANRFWAMDVLLSHYDVVGMEYDNLLARQGFKDVHRVETGGAMQFRAQGALKNDWKVGGAWTEPWTMRGTAKDGAIPMGSIKPVFGQMSDSDAAMRLSTLKTLDLATLDKAWSDLGMTAQARLDNMAVIKSRLAQIPDVQKKLGMAALAPTPVAPKPPAAIASSVKYKLWNPSSDAYGKKLAVTFKPWFEDFKQFNPVAGVTSTIVAKLSAGVQLPQHAIAQGPAKIARLNLRVAFARSYNMAVSGGDALAALPPAVKEFWVGKLGLVDTSKAPDVEKVVATHLPPWDKDNDPFGYGFVQAHPDWIAKADALPKGVQNDIADFGAKNFSQGLASTYDDYLHGGAMLKAGAAPEVAAFWKSILGDLAAQPEKLEPVAKVYTKAAAIEAAKAGPYDDLIQAAKESVSLGGDIADTELANTVMESVGKLDPNEVIAGLVKFGLAGNEESAANLVADWVEHANAIKAELEEQAHFDAVVQAAQAKVDQPAVFGPPTVAPSVEWVNDFDHSIGKVYDVTSETVAKKWADFNAGELTVGGSWYDVMKAWSEETTMEQPTLKSLVPPDLKPPSKEWLVSHVNENFDVASQKGIENAWETYKYGGAEGIDKQWADAFKHWEMSQSDLSVPTKQLDPILNSQLDKLYEKWSLDFPSNPVTFDDFAKQLVSWASGAEIGWGPGLKMWLDVQAPTVLDHLQYVKPEDGFPKPPSEKVAAINAISTFAFNGWEESGGAAGFKPTFLKALAAGWSPEHIGDVYWESVTKGQYGASLIAHGKESWMKVYWPKLMDNASLSLADVPVDVLSKIADTSSVEAAWRWIYTGGPTPSYPGGNLMTADSKASWKSWFEHHNLEPADVAEAHAPAMVQLPVASVEKEAFAETLTTEKLNDLTYQAATDFGVQHYSAADIEHLVAQYQKGETTEQWTAWFEKNAPELKVEGKELGAQTQSAVSFAPSKTLLAWSPTNDKWAKQFGKAHPKLYTSFSAVFKSKAFVQEITKDLVFPAYALKNPVKVARLRMKVALARTYNMAVKGQLAELGALDPNLVKFWAAKLGENAPTQVVTKMVGPVDASVANLVRIRDELKVKQSAWYPEFRTTFGHTITMKIVPELESTVIDIPASSTRERELRALAFSKSYLMAKAGDVAGLRRISEELLNFWDEKLGGNLIPRVAVSLEGAPWVHDLNALYGKWSSSGREGRQLVSNIEGVYSRSTRSSEFNSFKSGTTSFTGSSNQSIRNAGVSVLKGQAGGQWGKAAKAMMEAVQDAKPAAPALKRTESWSSVASRAGTTKDGLEALFKSWVGTDKFFQMDLVSTQTMDGHWSGDLQWRIEKGAQAYYAAPLSSSPGEKEWITAGRFKILKVERDGALLVVYVRQLGVFEFPD